MQIEVKSENWFLLLLDYLMIPIMYLLQFPSLASPQRTHFWNNKKHNYSEVSQLDPSLFVSVGGDKVARKRWLGVIPLFHMPIFGGWKKFVILEPKIQQDSWFVGWVPGDLIGISRVKLTNKVKLLRGPQTAYFFGLNEHGEQIEIKLVDSGEVGVDKNYTKVQFL